MGTQSSTLIMRLIDGISGPAGSAAGSLRGLNAATATFQKRGSAFAAGMLGASLKQVAGLALAYKGAMGVKSSLEAEATEARLFTRIGLRAQASAAELKKARDQVAEIAMQSGLAEEAVQQGLFTLAKGPRSLAKAMEILPDAAKVAQAYEIEVKQAAGTTAAMVNQLKIKPADVMAAWDGIASAAHAGRIQVNEFAEGLPGLMTQAARIGWTGTDGLKKILSVAQMVAPAYATTQETFQALESVIGKMGSDRVVGKFKKMGIDVRAEMDKARKSGKDMLETFYNLVLKATKGDMSIVDRIFPKEDFQKFFYALQQYKNKMDLQAKIKFNTGETQAAFDKVANDAQAKIQKLKVAYGELGESFGGALVSVGAIEGLNALSGALNGVARSIDFVIEKADRLKGHKHSVSEIKEMSSADRRAEIERTEAKIEGINKSIAYDEKEIRSIPEWMRWSWRKNAIQKQYEKRAELSNYARYLRDQQERADRAEEIDRNMKRSMSVESAGPPYGIGQSSKVPRGAAPFGAGASPLVGAETDAMRLASSFQSAGAQAGAAIVSGISSGVNEATRLLEQFNANAKNLLRVTGSVDIKVNAPNLNGQHFDAPTPRRQ
jgi:TP901 family phage tail tape measure protein